MRQKLLPQRWDTPRWEPWLIAVSALAAFAGCLGGTWVFDDFALLQDSAITSPSGWWQCWRFTQTRPLSWFTFWANDQAGGENPIGYHAVNLALHIAAAVLLFDVLRRLIPDRAALIAAVLFAVHPALAEPVNYVYARPILLATLFTLLTIRSWIAGSAWAAAGWFAIAMLAKEECAAIPVFLLMLDLSRGSKLRRRPLAAMLGIALALGLRVVWAISVTPGALAGSQAGISPEAYLMAQAVVVLRYLRMLVIPWGFSVDYSAMPPAWRVEMVDGAIILYLAAMACRWFRRLGAGFWFLAGLVLLLPSSSIFPAADLAADRRMYLPMIGFAACAGLLLSRAHRAVPMAIACVLIPISIYYTGQWRDPALLWANAAAHAPEKLRPRLQLARSVSPEQGLMVLEQAARIAPQDPSVPAERGRILLALGRPAEALAAFGRALALDPANAAALNNRGAALAALGQPDAARADFERALQREPCLFDARLNLARLGFRTPDAGCRDTPRQRAMLSPAPAPR